MNFWKKASLFGLLLIISVIYFFVANSKKNEVVIQAITPLAQQEIAYEKNEKVEDEFPQHSTDKYLYKVTTSEQPAEAGLVEVPVVVSDKISNNYLNSGKMRTLVSKSTKDGKTITTTEIWTTKNPSYLTVANGVMAVGAVGAAVLTYMKACKCQNDLKFVQDYFQKKWHEDMLFFKNGGEDSPQKRIKLLDMMSDKFVINFTGIPSPYLNNKIVINLTENLSQQEFSDFLENLVAHVQKKNALTIHQGDIAQVLDGMKVQGKLSEADFKSVKKSFKEVPGIRYGMVIGDIEHSKLASAYHEAGHALIGALLEHEPILYATIIANQDSQGHVQPSRKNLSEEVFGYKDLENYRNNIKIALAGGIGMSLLEGKEKPDIYEFLSAYKYGMGSEDRKGSDIYQVYKEAESYLLHSDPVSWFLPNHNHTRKIHFIIEDCYDEIYDALDANKEQLVQMGDELYKKKVLPASYIYEVANTAMPESDPILKYIGL